MERYFVLRLPLLFGLGGRPEKNKLLTIIKKAKAGEKTVLRSDAWSSVCATRDVGWAIGKIVSTGNWGTYHIASEPAVSRAGLMRYFLKQIGFDPNLVEDINYKDSIKKPAKRARYVVMTSVLLEPTFGFSMSSWQIGMQKYVDELKKQGVI